MTDPEIPTRQDGPWVVVDMSIGELRILAGEPPDLRGFVDVELRSFDGRHFLATFGTLADVGNAMTRWRQTGECLGGRYLFVSDLVIVDTADVATIVAAVDDLLTTRELAAAFEEVKDHQTEPAE